MPQYLVLHNVEKYPASQEEWIELWRSIHLRSNENARWLQSFFEPEAGKLYCEWEASSTEEIKACIDAAIMQMAPIESIKEIVLFNPEWLDESSS